MVQLQSHIPTLLQKHDKASKIAAEMPARGQLKGNKQVNGGHVASTYHPLCVCVGLCVLGEISALLMGLTHEGEKGLSV